MSIVNSSGKSVSKYLSVSSYRRNRTKKRLIFNTAEKLKRKEMTQQFDDLFQQTLMLNSKLQAKVDFFYKPYEGSKKSNLDIPNMDYSQDVSVDGSHATKDSTVYAKRAQQKWKRISNNILRRETNDLRGFLKSVNSNMYSDLLKLGQKYFKGRLNRKSTIMKNSDSNKNMRNSMDAALQSQPDDVESKYTMLKTAIKERVEYKKQIKNYIQNRRSLGEPTNKFDIVSPLVYISRLSKANNAAKEETWKEVECFNTNEFKRQKETVKPPTFDDFLEFIDPRSINKTYKNLKTRPKTLERPASRVWQSTKIPSLTLSDHLKKRESQNCQG